MRALLPDRDGFADADGVKVFYEVFGDGNEPTVVLSQGWQIHQSRLWKGQVPHLARRFRVVTFDWPGNGRSDRPGDASCYLPDRCAGWIPAVMDATGTESVIVVGLSGGCFPAVLQAADHADRTRGIVLVGGLYLGADPRALDIAVPWRDELATLDEPAGEGWAMVRRETFSGNDALFERFARFFNEQCFPEAHLTKFLDDALAWALQAGRADLLALLEAWGLADPVAMEAGTAAFDEMLDRIRCPALVICGDGDVLAPLGMSELLAEKLGAELVVFEGSGHVPFAKQPVRFNLLVEQFVGRLCARRPRRTTYTRAASRPKRALFVSSPIGLGHALRDLAIARELGALCPDLRIDWFTQHPVTELLRGRGERIHPACARLANESAHFESEAGEHDLHAFQALRNMDEVLVSNFMLFNDVVADTPYDLWIADEGWDVDHFLHENPELKRAAYVWLTDFVGLLPAVGAGEREQELVADYNNEMLSQVARYPRLRDRAIFVGNPEDIPPGDFGPGTPAIREWTQENFSFAGYVTGFDRDGLPSRAELGYRDDETVCLVAVGGSGVGTHLLRKVIAAVPDARRAIPNLRMVVVAGPRIDPASLDAPDGIEVRGYVPDLYAHLAACDVAVVQGGLTTCMELAAFRKPFLYFPLRNHFEQQRLVAYRLDRYRAGRGMDYASATPEVIAAALAEELRRPVHSVPVESDGAVRAASMIAALI